MNEQMSKKVCRRHIIIIFLGVNSVDFYVIIAFNVVTIDATSNLQLTLDFECFICSETYGHVS